MSPTLKRILLIIALLIAAGLIGYGIYYLGFRRSITPPPDTGLPPTQTGQLPVGGNRTSTVTPGIPVQPTTPGVTSGFPGQPNPGGVYYQPTAVQQLTSTTPSFLTINKAGAVRYHDLTNGKFYRLLPDGTVRTLSDRVFYGVENVTWAPNSDKAVLEYPDGFKTVYNFETERQVTLPQHWTDFSFSPDGSQIAAKSIGLSPENRWLITVNDDGTGTRLIEPMGEYADRVSVNWSPSRQTVAFSQTGDPIGQDRRQILLIGLNGENFKALTVEGLDFLPKWSPTGNRLLYSVDSARSDFKPELWITDAYGDSIDNNRQSLRVNTWADKCTFGADDSTLFCAVPRELPSGAGISPELARSAVDDIFKFDLKTGSRSPIPTTGTEVRVSSMSYDSTNKRLLFTDFTKPGIFQSAGL